MDAHQDEYEYCSEAADDNPMSEGSNGAPQQQEIEEYARFLGMNPGDAIDR